MKATRKMYLKLFPIFEEFFDLGFEFIGKFRVIHEELFNGVPALSELGLAIAEPGSAFLDDIQFSTARSMISKALRYLRHK